MAFAGALALAAMSLSPSASLAKESPSDADEARAEELFESALSQQRLGQFEQACETFEASAKLATLPHALLQVGNCRERSDPLGALASFEAALAAADTVTDSSRRQAYEGAAKKRIEALLARIPTLTFHRPPTRGVQIEVAAEPGGAAQVVTRFGEPRRFNPGKYRVTASAPGSEVYLLNLELKPAQRLEIDIPWLAPLPHRSGEGGAAEGAMPLDEPSGALRLGVWPLALTGAGGALILTSLVTGRISSTARGELEKECEETDELTGLRVCGASLAGTKQRVEDYALATDLLWIGGTLLAGAGVTWFLLDQNAPQEPKLNAGCSATGCGVSMAGSF